MKLFGYNSLYERTFLGLSATDWTFAGVMFLIGCVGGITLGFLT